MSAAQHNTPLPLAAKDFKGNYAENGNGNGEGTSTSYANFEHEITSIFVASMVRENGECRWSPSDYDWAVFNEDAGHWTLDKHYCKRRIATVANGVILAMDSPRRVQTARQKLRHHVLSSALEWAKDYLHLPYAHEWNPSNDLLGVKSGVVDLRTGKPRKARRGEYIKRHLDYDPEFADTPHFDGYLKHLANGDAKTERWLLRFLGYCLTGETQEDVLLFLLGAAGTGKSTFTGLLTALTEGYGMTLDSAKLASAKNEPHSEWLAQIQGKRVVVANETEPGKRWHTARINPIVTGSVDKVRANLMHKDSFEFNPTCKLIVTANHAPSFRSGDGFARRVRVLPCDRQPAKPIANFLEKLLAEKQAILGKLIREASAYYAEGMTEEPKAMQLKTESYIADQDTIAKFMGECVAFAPNGYLGVKDLAAKYKDWCIGEDVRYCKKDLREYLEGLPNVRCVKHSPAGGTAEHWKGLALAEQGAPSPSADFDDEEL